MLADLAHDFRLGFRQLAKSPGFTVAAVLCLALGIGANTAVFSFANFFLFRPLPVSHPDELVRGFVSWSSGLKFGSFSYPDYVDFRARNEVLSGFAATSLTPFHLSADGRNERLWGELVSADYFQVLGVEVPIGRAFLPEEETERGAHPVLVISHGLWRTRFGGDPGIVGRGVTVNGHPFTIVGVAAESFGGSQLGLKVALWTPLGMQEVAVPGGSRLEHRDHHWLSAIGRLKPGITVRQAETSLNGLMAQLVAAYPEDNVGKSVVLYPEAQSNLHPMVRGGFVGFLALMLGVVGLVLLLACSNVASLLLARSAARRREIAVRLALGASRARLVRQLLAESTALALAAGGAGLLLALWLTRFLASQPPPVDFPLAVDLSLNFEVLAFTLGASLVASVLVGLAPALQSSRPELVPALKDGGGAGRGGSRMRRLLVGAQVALSLVLLVGAALVLKSLANARHLPLGFEPERQLLAGADLDLQGYDKTRGRELFRALEERVDALPGVTAAAWAQRIPLTFSDASTSAVAEGYVTPEGSNPPSINFNQVGPGYFEALGLPLQAGRGFEPADGPEGQRVIVVNRAFADKYWPGADPLGKRVNTFGGEHVVVGVAATGKYFSLGEAPKPYMYLPIERYYDGSRVLHVRTAGDPTPLLEAVRREIQALDPNLPVRDLKLMKAQLGFVLFPARLAAVVVSVFAVLALLLASVGLYAVIAFWVSQRTPEIGIRMALGARAADVQRLVMRQGLSLTGAGLAAGLALGVGLAALATKVLYGISPGDPRNYLAAAALLAVVALAATLIPARRATRVDPTRALRAQ